MRRHKSGKGEEPSCTMPKSNSVSSSSLLHSTSAVALRELNHFPFSAAFMHQRISFIAETESILMLTLMNCGGVAFQGPVLFPPSFQIAVYHSEEFVGCALFTFCLIWRFGETAVSQAPHYVLHRNTGLINGGYIAQSVQRKIQ